MNKHSPKDPFGLPRIDQVVDSTAGCSMLSFLDCYSGYHQINLAKEDEEKAAFITPFGAFCHTSMLFGLKNAGATYQRAIQTCLADHWSKRVEAVTPQCHLGFLLRANSKPLSPVKQIRSKGLMSLFHLKNYALIMSCTSR